MKIDPTNPAALKALLAGDLGNALVASVPGGIEAQEAAGQAILLACDWLPIDGLPPHEELERLGFKIGARADDLFVHCELPEGWKKVPTEHSMWSDLLDANGRKRASIFYKAAFYDRRAHIQWEKE